eukprot:1139322-Pelagomonas_calceolata.AAC.8
MSRLPVEMRMCAITTCRNMARRRGPLRAPAAAEESVQPQPPEAKGKTPSVNAPDSEPIRGHRGTTAPAKTKETPSAKTRNTRSPGPRQVASQPTTHFCRGAPQEVISRYHKRPTACYPGRSGGGGAYSYSRTRKLYLRKRYSLRELACTAGEAEGPASTVTAEEDEGPRPALPPAQGVQDVRRVHQESEVPAQLSLSGMLHPS